MNNYFTSDIPTIGQLMYDKGYIIGTQGNLSFRVDQKDQSRIFITPTGFHKGFLRPDEIICVKMNGEVVQPGELKPSSDLAMHLAIYQLREDVKAIIHAHPPLVVAGDDFSDKVLSKEIVEIQSMFTDVDNLSAFLAKNLKTFDTLIIPGHGTITIGKTLQEAFIRLEELEYEMKIWFLTKIIS